MERDIEDEAARIDRMPTPAEIAYRLAAIQKCVDAIKALPILDPRPIQETVDDTNDLSSSGDFSQTDIKSAL